MTRKACDGAGLLAAYRAAVENLEAHVDEVNGLNVFPVPDGDTGSNMLATVRAALDEGQRVADQPADRIAGAISFGALMGARGNSGVITSQIFRGMAEGLGGKRRFNGLDLAHALTIGTQTAYGAVVKPVEGTILTVIREASAAAVTAAELDSDLETVLVATVDAAEKAVARTPSLLPILREAGVVDAGGQGLYRLFQGALLHILGRAPAGAVGSRQRGAAGSALVAHADQGFGYETMFLVQPGGSDLLDLDTIRTHLESIGESVLVAGDGRAVKVHVHSERPDEVIGFGLSLGNLSRISVENLDNQARDVREQRAAEFTGGAGSEAKAAQPRTGGVALARIDGDGTQPLPRVPLAVVAVAAGDGLARIFESFGVASVVRGGQSDNPSTGELAAAVESVAADEVLILPNNPNVVLAARQVAGMTGSAVHVVPTRNAAEGVAALLALDPSTGADANAAAMTEAGRSLRTMQVTEAVRDAKIAGRKVKKGQTIVLGPDDGLIAADGDRQKAVLAALATLPGSFELLTLYYGDGADLAEAEGVSRRITDARPGLQVDLVHGGQPYYRYLISVE
ncbi:MAG TPA: DAK2 domain-containing protein [Candidatus Limnocylindrales bacterium]